MAGDEIVQPGPFLSVEFPTNKAREVRRWESKSSHRAKHNEH